MVKNKTSKLRCKHIRLSDVTVKNFDKVFNKLKVKLNYYIRQLKSTSSHSCTFENIQMKCQSYEEDIHIICEKFGKPDLTKPKKK